MKRILLTFLFTGFLTACFHAAPKLEPTPRPDPPAFTSVRGLAWGYYDEEHQWAYGNHCTAFSINKAKHFWLTAGHCVTQKQDFEIDGQPATVVYADFNVDLAVLYTPSLPEVPAFRLQTTAPYYEEHIRVAGHPLGWRYPVIVDGKVITPSVPVFERTYMLSSVQVAPGNSGSPFFNDRNEVLGVVQIGIGCNPYCSVSGGSPWSIMVAFAEPYWEK
jgi:S1-C subfamily serine protease